MTTPRAPLPVPGRAGYAVDGLVAGATGLLVAEVLDVLPPLLGLPSRSSAGGSPLLAVAAGAVDVTPGWLKEWAISTFGTADKAVLLGGMAVVLALVFAGIGLLARTRPQAPRAAVAGLGAVAGVAILSRAGAGPLDLVPLVVGLLVTVALLRRMVSVTGREGPSRREALGLAGAAAGVALAGVAKTGAGAVLPGTDTPPVAVPTGAPAGPIVGADLAAGATPWVVPNDAFYRIDTAIVVPRLSAERWSLRVVGEVEREVTLTWAELLAAPLVERYVTLCCVSNEVGGDLVGNARWTGWPVRELLARAGPRPGADMVLSRSADGWTAGTPLDVLTDGRDALLAIAMNGTPLPPEHGFPVRLVVPGLYGYVSATKWVTELKVTRFAVDAGYWTPRGWSAFGPVKTASRIDVPRTGREVPAGRVAVAGVAWAMHRGIAAVQVRVDDGPWAAARLAAQPSVDAWRQWVFEWDATPGSHTLTVRAQDGRGEWQTDARARPDPDGATGHHTVTVRVS